MHIAHVIAQRRFAGIHFVAQRAQHFGFGVPRNVLAQAVLMLKPVIILGVVLK